MSVVEVDDRRARRNVVVLVAAQAILGAQLPMNFVVGGLVGGMLTGNPCLATLPISIILLGSMTTAPWMSMLMQRKGRQLGFQVGALAGAAGGAVSVWALAISSFPVLLLGAYLTGIYMSAHGFYRFAAADAASEAFRPKAVSWVMAGGLLSAIFGPQLNKVVVDLAGVPALAELFLLNPFVGTYLAVIVLNLVGVVLFVGLDLPRGTPTDSGGGPAAAPRTRLELLRSPPVLVAVICAMVSYSLMNLVMTATPLAVIGCGFGTDEANDIVSAHVLAMFAPSFFTGHLIARFGVRPIVSLGLVLLGAAGVVALSGVGLTDFYGALILLGLGWNFGFVGATVMLASAHEAHERGRVQGLNDLIVFGCVMLASLASGGLMNCSGSSPVAGWEAVNVAMVPFLALAGAALTWLVVTERRRTAA